MPKNVLGAMNTAANTAGKTPPFMQLILSLLGVKEQTINVSGDDKNYGEG